MLRPNEINEKTFEQVGDGVYSAKEVDAFLKEVSSSYEQVFKQNGELVRRLSLLANRLEAFRRQEEQEKKAAENGLDASNESIKNKLEQAKAVAQKMLDDAKERAIGIVNNANKESDRILVDLNDKIKEQRVALDLLNSKSEEFKKQLLEVYRQHLISIDSIPSKAEKIVSELPPDLEVKPEVNRPEYKVNDDNSDIFEPADSFANKLDEESKAEVIKTAEIPSDNADILPDSDDGIEDIFSDAPVESGSDTASGLSDESLDDILSKPMDDGFVFDFAGISFDDDDDNDIEEAEDEEDEEDDDVEVENDAVESESFHIETDSVPEEIAEPTSDNDIANVFTENESEAVEESDDGFEINTDAFLDDDNDDEFEDEKKHEKKSKGFSLKDFIKSKGNIENDSEEAEIESDDEESFSE